MSGKRVFTGIVVLAMAAAAAAGLFLAGSPEQERRRRFDQERLNDLTQISYAVDMYWEQDKKLPAALADLKSKRDVFVRSLKDPRTQMPYAYRPTATSTYELCAVFETDSEKESARGLNQPWDVQGQDFWRHPAGRKCFSLEARKNERPVKPD